MERSYIKQCKINKIMGAEVSDVQTQKSPASSSTEVLYLMMEEMMAQPWNLLFLYWRSLTSVCCPDLNFTKKKNQLCPEVISFWFQEPDVSRGGCFHQSYCLVLMWFLPSAPPPAAAQTLTLVSGDTWAPLGALPSTTASQQANL